MALCPSLFLDHCLNLGYAGSKTYDEDSGSEIMLGDHPAGCGRTKPTQESGLALPLLRWDVPSVLTGVVSDLTSEFSARYIRREEANKQEVLPLKLKADFPRDFLCF